MMDVGTGIAIAGIWIFVSSCALSKAVKGGGFLLAIIIATIITMKLIN